MTHRWWIYQKERFPVVTNGVLIAAFSLSAVSHSILLRNVGRIEALPVPGVVAFVSAFLFFLQLRICDEFKDFEDDRRYRPYRPVPRGLVTLKELAMIGWVAAIIQLGLALWLSPQLALLLLLVWGYLGLMTQEFFVHHWLKAHPLMYLFSHMVIMPLINLYATACDWLVAASGNLGGRILLLHWFLLVSFFNGIIIEIGRKIRAPEDEETGVETYSFLWGRRNAVLVWLGVCAVTAVFALLAGWQIRFLVPVSGLLVVLLMAVGIIARNFLIQPDTQQAKRIEMMSGVWTLLMYLSLGVIPLFFQA